MIRIQNGLSIMKSGRNYVINMSYEILEEQNLIKIYRVLYGARDSEIKKMG